MAISTTITVDLPSRQPNRDYIKYLDENLPSRDPIGSSSELEDDLEELGPVKPTRSTTSTAIGQPKPNRPYRPIVELDLAEETPCERSRSSSVDSRPCKPLTQRPTAIDIAPARLGEEMPTESIVDLDPV